MLRAISRLALRLQSTDQVECELLQFASLKRKDPGNALEDLAREYERRGYRVEDLLCRELRAISRSLDMRPREDVRRDLAARRLALRAALAVRDFRNSPSTINA